MAPKAEVRRPKAKRVARGKVGKAVMPPSGNDKDNLDGQPVGTFVQKGDTNPFGSVTEAELSAVAQASFATYTELDANELMIGVESLAKALAARMAHSAGPSDAKILAVFLLSDRARDLGAQLAATREPIIDNGSKRFTGRLWVASPNLTSGYWVPFKGKEAAGIFDEVEKHGVGSHPAMVFDPNATDAEVRFYPRGLADANRVQRFIVAQHAFSVEALDKVLDSFHQTSIRTPDAAVEAFNLWANGKKYHPRQHAEAFLQGWLKSVIDVAFRDHSFTRFEVRGNEGRCDLLILSRHRTATNAFNCHAALELKVLRSFTSGGSQVSATVRTKAIAKGLNQAIAYKSENSAEHGLLCCFDMRKPTHCDHDGCLARVSKKAQQKSIELRRFRLYGSSEDLRDDKYGGAPSKSP
jgi:hypothetical protein